MKRITRKYTMIYCYPINHITVNCSHQSSLTIAHNEIFIVVVSPWYQNPPPSRRSRVFGDPRLASCLAFRNGSLLTVILLWGTPLMMSTESKNRGDFVTPYEFCNALIPGLHRRSCCRPCLNPRCSIRGRLESKCPCQNIIVALVVVRF